MILIVSSNARERAAFTALCESREWTVAEGDSVRALVRLLKRWTPKITLVRHKLGDGFSDNVIAALREANLLPSTKVIVMIAAGTSPVVEARQLALGSDCVLRDPVRTEVLVEYLAKYLSAAARPSPRKASNVAQPIEFCSALLHPTERSLMRAKRAVSLTPREVDLIEVLTRSRGAVVSYEMLYSEILGRKFQGDTSNMRVLLGKVGASVDPLGIQLRDWVEVIPKLGYRYGSRATR